ncbi:MAG: MerR family transcriptional regulator [Clostridium sp.]
MEKLFSIGEVSKIKNITIKALRYYQKVGILIPKHIDSSTGYRYYSLEQFIHIDIIRGCRELGTSIIELQELFKESDTDKLINFMKIKRIEAEETIKKMKSIINNIDSLSDAVSYSKELLNDKEVNKKFIEKRYIATVPCNEIGNLKELIYYSNLEKIMEEQGLKPKIEGGIMYMLDSNNNFKEIKVFNVVEVKDESVSEYIQVLNEGMYLTVNYTKENEKEQTEKLHKYIKENSISVKMYIEVDLFNDIFSTDSYSSQIQAYIGRST